MLSTLPSIVLLVFVAAGEAAEVGPAEGAVAAEIEHRGDTVTIDEQSPDKPVIGVDMHRTPWVGEQDQVTDLRWSLSESCQGSRRWICPAPR